MCSRGTHGGKLSEGKVVGPGGRCRQLFEKLATTPTRREERIPCVNAGECQNWMPRTPEELRQELEQLQS